MALLDGGRHDARRADAVAAADQRLLRAVLVEERRAERRRSSAILELEDVADLDRGLEAKRAAADGARVVLPSLADVREARRVVAPRLDAEQVPAVAVRAGDELPLAQRLVCDDLDVDPDRPERASTGSERRADLVVRRGSVVARERRRAAWAPTSRSSPRTSPSTSVPSVFTTGIAFDVAAASMPRNSARASIVVTPGVATSYGASSASGRSGARGTPRAISRSAA